MEVWELLVVSFLFFFFHVFDSSSSLLSAPLAAVSGAVSSYTARFHPWPTDAGVCGAVRCFGGVKSKMFACQPVCMFKGFSFMGWQSHSVSC